MKATQPAVDRYLACYDTWQRCYAQQKSFTALQQALDLTARQLLLLSFDVGICQREAAGERIPSSDPRLTHSYNNFRISLNSVRQACEPIGETLTRTALPSEHLLEAFDLFEAAVSCGSYAHRIDCSLQAGGLIISRDTPSLTLTYAVMVRIGKSLDLGYDTQTKFLAPVIIPDFKDLRSADARERKMRTLERNLRESFQHPLPLDGAMLLELLPRIEGSLKSLAESLAPLRWVLEGLPKRDDDDDE